MRSEARLPAHKRTDFWSNVARGDGCWLWTGALTSGGYGVYHCRGERWQAHRMAVVLSGRTLHDDDVVLHECDNPLCVNPEHLRIGTQRDNVRDAVSKGRSVSAPDARRRARERRQDDAIAYLDYLHANICGFANALNIGPLPHDFETWRKARYAVEEVA